MAGEKIISLRLQLKGDKQTLKQIDAFAKGLQESAKLLKDMKSGSANIDFVAGRVKVLTKEFKELNRVVNDYANNLARTGRGRSAASPGAGTSGGRGAGAGTTGGAQTQAQMRAELATLSSTSERYRELIRLIAQYRQRQNEITQELRNQQRAYEATTFAVGSYRQLNAELGRARAAFRDLSEAERRGAPGRDLLQTIQQLDTQLRRIDADMGIFTRNVGNYRDALGGLRNVTTQFFALAGVGIGVQQIVQTNAEISDSIANVAKTANASIPDIQALSEELKFRDTRTSLADQLKIAEIGGQLGETADTLGAFTGAIDTLGVALADEFGNDVGRVTKEVAGLRNTLGDFKTADTAGDILKLGNALNVLSASGNATAGVTVDIASRLAGLGTAFGLTAGQILGLSSRLDELNIPAERAGGSIQRVLNEIARSPELFAQVSGKSIPEFTETVNSDLVEAFTLVLDTIGKSGAKTTEFADILTKLGIDGVGTIEIFSKLGQDTNALRASIDLATDSLTNIDSITEEFNKKNATLGASLDRVKNAFINVTVNTGFQEFLGGILDGVAKFINVLAVMPKFLNENKVEIVALGLAILTLNQNLLLSSINAIKASQAYLLMTSSTARAELASKLLANAQKAIPLLLVVAGLYAVVKALQFYTKDTTAAGTASKSLADAQKEIAESTAAEIGIVSRSIEILKSDTISKIDKKKAIDELIRIQPEYLKGIDLESASVSDLTLIQKGLTDEIIKTAAAKKKAALQDVETQKVLEATLKLREVEQKGIKALTFLERQNEDFLGIAGRRKGESGQDFALRTKREELQKTIDEALATSDAIGKEFDAAFLIGAKSKELDARSRAENERDDRQGAAARVELAIKTAGEISKVNKDAAEKEKERREKEAQDIKDAAENIQKLQLDALDKTFEGRKERLKKEAELTIAALVGTPEQVATQTQLVKTALAKSIEEITTEQNAARQKAATELQKFNEEIDKGVAEFQKDGAAREVESVNRFYEARANDLRLRRAQQQAELEKALARGEISAAEFEQRRIQNEQDFAQKRLADATFQAAELSAAESQLLLKRLEQAQVDHQIELADIARRAEERRQALAGKIAGGVFAAGSTEATSEAAAIEADAKTQKLAAEQKFLEDKDKLSADFAQKEIERQIALSEQSQAITAGKNEKLIEQQKEYQAILNTSLNGLSMAFGEFIAGQEQDGKAFLKNMLNIALDALQKLILVQVAAASAQSFAQPDSVATFGATGAARAAILTGLITAGFGGLKALIASFEEGGAIPGMGATGEGVAQGASHDNGGIKTTIGGRRVEIEGGEHVLKNGRETYIINKRSSRLFNGELKSLHGNPSLFNPQKRRIAEQINTFRGFGRAFAPVRKFEQGGALSINPLFAPTMPQTTSTAAVEMVGLSNDLKDMIAATNARIDRLLVVADPRDLLNKGKARNEVKKARAL